MPAMPKVRTVKHTAKLLLCAALLYGLGQGANALTGTLAPAFAANAALAKGKQAFAQKNYGAALSALSGEAAKGNTEAQRLLGQMFRDGLGVPKDPVTAYFWYSRAAKSDAKATKPLKALADSLSQEQIALVEKRLADYEKAAGKKAPPPKKTAAQDPKTMSQSAKTKKTASTQDKPDNAKTAQAEKKPAVQNTTAKWFVASYPLPVRAQPSGGAKRVDLLNVGKSILVLGPAPKNKKWVQGITQNGKQGFALKKKMVPLDSSLGRLVLRRTKQNSASVLAARNKQTAALLSGAGATGASPGTGKDGSETDQTETRISFDLAQLAGHWSDNCRAYKMHFEPLSENRFRINPSRYPRPHIVQAQMDSGNLLISGDIDDIRYQRRYKIINPNRLRLIASQYERFGRPLSDLKHTTRYDRCALPQETASP